MLHLWTAITCPLEPAASPVSIGKAVKMRETLANDVVHGSGKPTRSCSLLSRGREKASHVTFLVSRLEVWDSAAQSSPIASLHEILVGATK
jgi:hypothetical protein